MSSYSGACGSFWSRRKLLEVWPPCWRGASAEDQTNVTGDAPALKKPEGCFQWVAEISTGLSTYFFDYSNRSPALRHEESLYGCCRPGRKQHRDG